MSCIERDLRVAEAYGYLRILNRAGGDSPLSRQPPTTCRPHTLAPLPHPPPSVTLAKDSGAPAKPGARGPADPPYSKSAVEAP